MSYQEIHEDIRRSELKRKTCFRCKQEKTMEGFSRKVKSSDGKSGVCKDCCNAVARARRVCKPKRNRYEGRSFPEVKTCHECKERLPFTSFYVTKSSSDGLTSNCIECFLKKDRAKHAQDMQDREWVERRSAQWVIARHNWRSRETGDGAELTIEDWLSVKEKYGNECLSCGSSDRLTVDHIVPVSKGGRNVIENIQPLCFTCNQSKNAKIIDYRPDEARKTA